TATQTVSVSVPGITVSSVTVGSGLQAGSNGSLGASQHSGVTVRVASANPSLFLVAPNATTGGTPFIDIPLANGNTFFSYVVQGADGATGSATITATATGFTQGSASNTVVQPAADIIFLTSPVSSTAANDPFQVRIGIPDALGNSIQSEQARASGLSALTATLNNATATAAQLVTSLGAGQSAQVSIIGGAARSPGTVATGGVEFDPLASGSTSVSVSIPGYRIIPASTVAVTVQ
ncbi:MAG: hypothetical protein OEV95_14840, partial [Gemmatimonadota bacterium]|nr:hypothetical protein [Gemmatimonadota bacterium]